ncbi:MAG: isovaleryl-CoA dehydrogenase [Betaproteobacteria bacterium]|nr:isovaleryl-CoA dehydrogenase [Betaproteobacteria bacterium]
MHATHATHDWSTHDVDNVVSAAQARNLYDTDAALREAVLREGAAWADDTLHGIGAELGQSEQAERARLANAFAPELCAYDPQGRRVDQVRFHPAWHELMAGIWRRGLHCSPWVREREGAFVARAAAFLLQGQVEAGTLCPTTMSFAAVPLLREQPGLWESLQAHLFSPDYDPADAPLEGKRGMLVGMGLTEKQGGSDLRAVATRARAIGAPGSGRAYTLVGHKWFFSAPQSDAHLVLARDGDAAPSCFYLPRWTPDGRRNALRLRRLKDKLGNRSNASAEVEFEDAWALLLGEPGRGIATMLRMAHYTRMDNVLGSAALLRAGVAAALHHARHRRAFSRPLDEQALMQVVLGDLVLESEAATALALRLAAAFERAATDPLAAALQRMLTPAAKFWVCKRAVQALAECMEVLGGNGYVEESGLPRLLREAPVNSIWEGSGNVVALDVLRALRGAPESARVLRDWLGAQGAAPAEALRGFDALCAQALHDDALARQVAQQLVLLVQATLLRAHAPQQVADAFCATRLQGARAGVFGIGLSAPAAAALLRRAWPLD